MARRGRSARTCTVALDAGGIANFFTPENAVDAFSFLAAYRRNQEWLLEVPPSQPDPEPPDLAAAERIREHALGAGARHAGVSPTRRSCWPRSAS